MTRPQNSTQNVDPDNAPDYDTEDEGDNLDDNDDLQDLYPGLIDFIWIHIFIGIENYFITILNINYIID